MRSPRGSEIRFPLPGGPGTYAAVARREELDAALVELARRAGVQVCEGHGVVGLEWRGDHVVARVEGLGAVTARYAVGADGMWSTVRKLTDAQDEPGYLGEWHAFRQYFANVAEPAATQLWTWFDADLLPGYAWSFPLAGGRANVGFGILRRPGEPTRSMKALWAELLDRPHIRAVLGHDAVPEGAHKAWPIPARVASTDLHALGGRVLFVGDAARATDPLTGEGIGQALETGELAAQALMRAGPTWPGLAAEHYTDALRRTLVKDHRLAGVLSRVLSIEPAAAGAAAVAGATGWTRRNFARWLFEDYPRAVLATPSRWKRHMLAGPGAFSGAAEQP